MESMASNSMAHMLRSGFHDLFAQFCNPTSGNFTALNSERWNQSSAPLSFRPHGWSESRSQSFLSRQPLYLRQRQMEFKSMPRFSNSLRTSFADEGPLDGENESPKNGSVIVELRQRKAIGVHQDDSNLLRSVFVKQDGNTLKIHTDLSVAIIQSPNHSLKAIVDTELLTSVVVSGKARIDISSDTAAIQCKDSAAIIVSRERSPALDSNATDGVSVSPLGFGPSPTFRLAQTHRS